jgi:general L-amino acid transport system substrate-binding protein
MLAISTVDAAAADSTLQTVKTRGQLICGVVGSEPGFSLPDSKGVMQGIDADECRAVAAAVLGDANAIKFVLLTSQQRLTALQSGEVDVLYANLTWTMSRETTAGVQFASIHYYDGQGFLVKKSLGVDSATKLDGASVCLTTGGTAQLAVQEYFASKGLKYTAVVFGDVEETRKAFLANRCDAMSTDSSSLAGFKASQGPNAGEYVILPERISNEPLGGAVRKGDGQWYDIVRWSHFALVQAEIFGMTAENIDTFKTSTDPRIRRFLGLDGTLGQALGVKPEWAYTIVKSLGNFGQIWDRHIVGVDRGLNRVWTQGGLQYAPPFR